MRGLQCRLHRYTCCILPSPTVAQRRRDTTDKRCQSDSLHNRKRNNREHRHRDLGPGRHSLSHTDSPCCGGEDGGSGSGGAYSSRTGFGDEDGRLPCGQYGLVGLVISLVSGSTYQRM